MIGKNLPDFFKKNSSFVENVDTVDDAEVESQHLLMSEASFTEYLQSCISQENCILTYQYNDYNNDGDCELFALVGREENDNAEDNEQGFSGEIWFVNQEGARLVEKSMNYCNFPYPFLVNDVVFLAFEKFYTSDSLTYLWGVNAKGEPYQPNLSGKGNGLSCNDYNEIELIHSTQDFLDEGLGHTWKPYYFYWGGTNFREYGGLLISSEELLRLDGAEELLAQIRRELEEDETAGGKGYSNVEMKEIYYRENGIININYKCAFAEDASNTIYNYTATLRYRNNDLKIIPAYSGLLEEGYYLDAFIPAIATYPKVFLAG